MTDVIIWSTWIGGLAIGLYAISQLALSGHALGVSTGYGNLCALGSKKSFFRTGAYKDAFNWRLWFIIGLPLGGLFAALTSPGTWEFSMSMGEMYNSVLPDNAFARAGILTLGGVSMGFGARMAGGCTSGHGIAGLSVFNWPSVLALAMFFVGGIVAVHLLFGLF